CNKWDQEQHEPREIRLPTLTELEIQLGIKNKVSREETQIPETFIRVEDLIFEECLVGRDLERPHKNRSLMSKWLGK
ncbi:15693_t:CDS:1, partial [Funneliformis geosporum]